MRNDRERRRTRNEKKKRKRRIMGKKRNKIRRVMSKRKRKGTKSGVKQIQGRGMGKKGVGKK